MSAHDLTRKMREQFIKDLELKGPRSLEVALQEALDNSTPEHPGHPNREKEEEEPEGSEWL